jgi:ribosomal protein S18 acetylase RimI-like enzyme
LPFGGSGEFVIAARYPIRTSAGLKDSTSHAGRCRRRGVRDDVARRGPVLRPYRPGDAQGLRDVCLRTAQAGGDATGLYVSDDLMPDVFATPYVEFAPQLAFVLASGAGAGAPDAGERVQGYILGVADTARFVDWFRAEWVPALARRYEHVVPPRTRCELIRHLGFTPERMLLPELDRYPAHLHIDILPPLQRQGWGRALVGALVAALRAQGVPGLHLTMDRANVEARRFYDRLGFRELPSSRPEAPALGIEILPGR